MRSSARNRSYESRSCRLDSNERYFVSSFLMLITLVIRLDRVLGKEGWAMASLNWRCGSGVIRHIDVFREACRECGSRTLRGFRRFWSVMNFLEVRTSHIGSTSEDRTSSKESSDVRRFLVLETLSFFCTSVLICLRSALDALSVYSVLDFFYAKAETRPT